MKKRAAEAAGLANTPQSTRCIAHGCPMWGSLAHETKAPYRLWCCPHFFTAPEHTQAVTAELNRQLPLIDKIRQARLSRQNDRAFMNELVAACQQAHP